MYIYRIAHIGGRGKLWRIGNFKNLVGKTLVNWNELTFSSSIKRHHLHATLNLKTTIVYFIIMCKTKMVHTFAVSNVVRGYHECKDIWSAPNDGAYNFLVKENWVIQEIAIGCSSD